MSAASAPTPLTRETTVEQVARSLRGMMMTGVLLPGEWLRESAVASSLAVGRSTVREALHLLSQQGLVTQHAHRGARVVQPSTADVRDIYRTRRLLERAGVEASRAASSSRLARLRRRVDDIRSAVTGEDRIEFADKDLAFHAELVGFLDSPRMNALFDRVRTELRLILALSMRTPSRYEPDVVKQHADLYDLIAREETDRCIALLAAHLDDGETLTLELLEN